jgi:hypothetical protein
MDLEIPSPEEYESKDEWMFCVGKSFRDRIEECRAGNDKAALAQAIAAFDAFVAFAAEKGGNCTLTMMDLVELTTEPKRRMEVLELTYKSTILNVEDYEWPEQQASSCCEATWLLREMALLHERAGDHAAAHKCFKDALAHSHRAGDFAYTHFMSEWKKYTDGDEMPIRPRLMEDLARIRNHARNP